MNKFRAKLNMLMRKRTQVIAATLAWLVIPSLASAGELEQSDQVRGRYLIVLGGCNDCHTAGYAASGGATPEAQWLLGDTLGYLGPWCTTYPSNLRRYFADLSEDQLVSEARTIKTRPPMPWWTLNAMTEDDLRAVYRYARSLPLIESTVPNYVPPGETPPTPVIQWPAPPGN